MLPGLLNSAADNYLRVASLLREMIRGAYCVDKIFTKILRGGMINETVMRDNCCTWVLEKLAMADVEAESYSGKPEWFITDTRAFLLPKEKEKSDELSPPSLGAGHLDFSIEPDSSKFPVGNAEISSEQEVWPELTPELSKKMQEFFSTG